MDIIAQYRSGSRLTGLRKAPPSFPSPLPRHPTPRPMPSLIFVATLRSEAAAEAAASEDEEVVVAGPPPVRNAAPEVRPATSCAPRRGACCTRSEMLENLIGSTAAKRFAKLAHTQPHDHAQRWGQADWARGLQRNDLMLQSIFAKSWL